MMLSVITYIVATGHFTIVGASLIQVSGSDQYLLWSRDGAIVMGNKQFASKFSFSKNLLAVQKDASTSFEIHRLQTDDSLIAGSGGEDLLSWTKTGGILQPSAGDKKLLKIHICKKKVYASATVKTLPPGCSAASLKLID